MLGWMPSWLWVLLLMALWVLGLDSAPLLDVDEGAFSQASREMVASGDWGHTTLNGADRFDKPILVYWLQGLGLLAFGNTEMATRLPSAVAALMWCLAAVRFTQGWVGAQQGRVAAGVLATSVGVMLIGRAATADALLNALLCWSCLDLWRHLESGQKAPLRRAFLWMGLGLLTKGPVACLIPGAAVVVYLLSMGELRRLKNVLGDWRAWALLLAASAPWYAYALHRHGMAFVDGFFLQHNINRFVETREGHGGRAYYTLVVTPLLLLPWTPLLVSVLAGIRGLWREPTPRFLLCWSAFSLLFFSFSSTKLPHYLLYGSTPLLILMARELGNLRSPIMAGALALCQLVLFGALSSSQQAAGWLSLQTKDPLYQTLLSTAPAGPPGWALALVAGLWLFLWLWPGRPLKDRALLASLIGAFWVVLVAIPWWARTLQSPIPHLAQVAKAHGGPASLWLTRQPSFGFYVGQPTPSAAPQAGGVALIRKDRLPSDAQVRVIAEDRGFLLVEPSAKP